MNAVSNIQSHISIDIYLAFSFVKMKRGVAGTLYILL